MQHFYDGQIRRYITQIIRMLSNFYVKDIDGTLRQVPVMYGDLSKDVAAILNDNSENKFPSSPRIAVYINSLELDRNRLADSTFVSKLNIRERAYDSVNKQYLNKEGKNYTIERLMPTPYTLGVTVDIWTTNTDQKLQVLEQLLVFFNPSLEIQTTDNFVDWSSLTVVNLDSINYSSRQIGSGAGDEIDIATLQMSTPIYISAPAKVKKLGVIYSVITSIFDESRGTVDLGKSMPEILAYADTSVLESDTQNPVKIDEDGNVQHVYGDKSSSKTDTTSVMATTYGNYDLLVLQNTIQLLETDGESKKTWVSYVKAFPDTYRAGITEIRLQKADLDSELIGTVTISPLDEFIMTVNWDIDTLPSDTIITGPTGDKNKIDYIIDPLKTDPTKLKYAGLRLLILNKPIGNIKNIDGPDGWKNADNSDFIANENDIIEWDGSKWHVVFNSLNSSATVYTTNLNTGVQYKFNGEEWVLAYQGEYPNGTWRLVF